MIVMKIIAAVFLVGVCLLVLGIVHAPIHEDDEE